MSKTTKKYIRDKWTEILTLVISFTALIASFGSIVKSEEAIQVAKDAYVSSLPMPIVKLEDAYTITPSVYELPCRQQDGVINWETELVFVFRISNDGGRNVSLVAIDPEYEMEISRELKGKIEMSFFSEHNDLRHWIAEVKPNNQWPESFIEATHLNGYSIAIPPGEFRRLVVKIKETIIYHPTVKRNEIADRLIDIEWNAPFRFVFNHVDENFNGNVERSIKMFLPSKLFYNLTSELRPCP